MNLSYKAWLCLVFLSGSNLLYAQEVRVNQTFQDVPFVQMVESLESEYSLHFFYQEEWLDSLSVSFQATDMSLPAVLDRALEGTGLQYYLGDDGAVILSQQFAVVPTLSADFWNQEEESGNEAIANAVYAVPVAEEPVSPLENTLNRIYDIGSRNPSRKSSATVAGYIRTAKTGAPLEGASVFVAASKSGALTDGFGYYVLSLPTGDHKLEIQYVGKGNTYRNIRLAGDGQLDIELEEEVLALDEVVISGEKSQVESVQTGASKLNIAEIKTIPTLLGEADVLKISLSLPGVQSVGEGASGFNVRGGTTDQNLILLNGTSLYNPNHLFGFFSAFNPAVIQHADLYKSGIQAHYGGRASSVLDVTIRDGNKKQFIMGAGIGPVTSKAHIEGPMLKKKGTYIIGVRSTYANWVLRALKNPALQNSRAFFGDGIGKLNYEVNDNNFLTISGYHSRDRFQLNGDSTYTYLNTNASLAWRHAFNNQFSSRISTGFTNYQYALESDESPGNAFLLDYEINQGHFNIDFDLFTDAGHHLRFGWQNTYYELSPGQIRPIGDSSFVQGILLDNERGIESALYLGDEWTLSPRISVYGGIRFSGYAMLGAGTVFAYPADLPREPEFIQDTLSYGSGETIARYGGPEYRASARYKLNESLSLKFSYDKTRQYIHMLTNSIAVSPTDTWRLSNPHLKPQISDQFAIGLYRSIPELGFEVSLESYYKKLSNLLEYKDGANLLVNETLESDVISANGKSYGIELLIKKKTGQLNGWIAYTYSRTKIKADSPFKSERINGGNYYPANYDIPHNLNIITNYKFSRRVNFSMNLAYRTGRPATLPVLQYQLRDNVLAFFSDRNQFRIPDYFRMDFSLNFEGNHLVEKRGHSSWSFSLYNMTGRKNAYSVFTRVDDGNIGTYQLAVFGSVIPTLVYNFELR